MCYNTNMIVYVDAGTKNNGSRGNQQTVIVVADESGEILFEKQIGDYTNNEGEILAVLAALKNVYPLRSKEIYSDSRVAVGWAVKGKDPEKNKRKKKGALSDRHIYFINSTNTLLGLTGSTIQWIPREENKAGWYIENKYSL